MSLEREQRILAMLDKKVEKAFTAAEGALEQWVSYNPIEGYSQNKDLELYRSWDRRNEIYKRVLIQRDGALERVAELKKQEWHDKGVKGMEGKE